MDLALVSDRQVKVKDELPLIWQKMSDKLLLSINERFDKFEQPDSPNEG